MVEQVRRLLRQPRLVGDGWARIGEGSGSTNVLTGSGVDEAWTTARDATDRALRQPLEDDEQRPADTPSEGTP